VGQAVIRGRATAWTTSWVEVVVRRLRIRSINASVHRREQERSSFRVVPRILRCFLLARAKRDRWVAFGSIWLRFWATGTHGASLAHCGGARRRCAVSWSN